MIKKRYALVALGVAAVLLGSLLYNSVVSGQSGGEYDPWLDYNEDGTIDVSDLHSLGYVYGSQGDSTKNVSVTNWPPTHASVTIWWDHTVVGPFPEHSIVYNASGFGHARVHILAYAPNLVGDEQVDVYLDACLMNQDRTDYRDIHAVHFQLNFTVYSRNVTVPVPSEFFRFSVHPGAATDTAFFLSFYLTWA